MGRAARRHEADQAKSGWMKFAALPGHQLKFRPAGGRRWELTAADGQLAAVVREGMEVRQLGFAEPELAVTACGREYRLQSVGLRIFPVKELVDDATGHLVLRLTGSHFDESTISRMHLRDGTTVEFSVTGHQVRNATLSAIDPSGQVLITCRVSPAQPLRRSWSSNSLKGIEVRVSPAGYSNPGVVLHAVVAAELLKEYVTSPGGG